MAGILRGEIRWADLDPVRGREQGGRRPVLVISQDVFNEHSGTAIVMAITSRPQRAGFPLTLKLSEAGLPKESWLKISQIRTLSVERIGERIGRMDAETLASALEGFNEICG
ncbi:MAG: type II toxin-antitoxin system PemK/MazF family toxin [Candidatus Aminicenantes bacterium]|nr:type II toxin-antitoxin system PemK/MazF family toxin [Candidatus Aminicenantes bacterium]